MSATIGDITPAICERIRNDMRDFRIQTERSDERAAGVTVYDSIVPKVRRSAAGEASGPSMPYICPRAVAGDDAWQDGIPDSSTQVEISMATERADEDGYNDILAMIDRLRASFLDNPMLRGGSMRVEKPISWAIQDTDTYPQWFGMMSISVQIPQPIESHEEHETYGDE